MARTCSGRVGAAASMPFAAFLAAAEPQVSEPVHGWHVRLCGSDVLDDRDRWQAEIRQALVEELTNQVWKPTPGDIVRAVPVRFTDLPPQERQQLSLPEDSGAIVVFVVEPARRDAEIPEHIRDLNKARWRAPTIRVECTSTSDRPGRSLMPLVARTHVLTAGCADPRSLMLTCL